MSKKHLAIYLKDHFAGSEAGLAILEHIEAAHGVGRIADITARIRREIEGERTVLAQLLDRLDESTAVLTGEVEYAVAHSAAVRLGDVVFRRTSLGSTGHPGRTALARAGDVMARRLGWSAERQAEEAAEVESRYPQPAATAQ